MAQKRVLIISGTRPEAIKLAPLYMSLKERGVHVDYAQTGQHSELHDQVTSLFGVTQSAKMFLKKGHRDLASLCS